MESNTSLLRLALDALLLREAAYRAMRDGPNPVRRGLTLIVVIGVVVGLAGVVGAVVFGLTAPDFGAIQDAVWDGMMAMPWLDEIPAADRDDVIDGMSQGYDIGWQIARFFIPSISGALINAILKPLGMVIFWLIYGLLAYASARVLGGRGTLGATYGTTALAATPQILGVLLVVPTVQTAGLGVWALICSYLALKTTHDLSPGRSAWATIIPYIVIVFVAAALAAAGAIVMAALIGAGFGGIGASS